MKKLFNEVGQVGWSVGFAVFAAVMLILILLAALGKFSV